MSPLSSHKEGGPTIKKISRVAEKLARDYNGGRGKYISQMREPGTQLYAAYVRLQRYGLIPALGNAEFDKYRTFSKLPEAFTLAMAKEKYSVAKLCMYYQLDLRAVHGFFNEDYLTFCNHPDIDRFIETIGVDFPSFSRAVSFAVTSLRKAATCKKCDEILETRAKSHTRRTKVPHQQIAWANGWPLHKIAKHFNITMTSAINNLTKPKIGAFVVPKIGHKNRARVQLFPAAKADMGYELTIMAWAAFYRIQGEDVFSLVKVLNNASIGYEPQVNTREAEWVAKFRADFPAAMPEVSKNSAHRAARRRAAAGFPSPSPAC